MPTSADIEPGLQPTTLADGFPPAGRDDWMALVEKALKGRPFDGTLTTRTAEGVTLQPLYARGDAPEAPAAGLRCGARPGGGWDIRQLHAHPDARVTNAEVRRDLARGATSLALRLDPAGAAGVRVRSSADLAAALDGVDLSVSAVALRAGAAAVPALDAFLELLPPTAGEAIGAGHDLGLDPMGTLAATGRLPVPVETALDDLVAATRRAGDRLPAARTVVVDTTPIYEAGANEVTDLGAMLATTVLYLRALEAGGLDIDTALRRIGVELAVGVDVFQAVAKLRAARLLWARLAEVCGARPAARSAHLSVRMAARVVARRDVWVNMIRATVSCFAAAVGGADAVTLLPYTHGLGLPDGFARRIARNTQIVLLEESSLHRVADPAGGSFYVERLTREYAERAWTVFQEIEAAGGMAEALVSGRLRDRVAGEWAERERAVARRRLPVTGVSEFPHLAEAPADVVEPPAPRPLGDDAFSRAAAAAAVEIAPLAAHRLGEGFEALRDASDRHLDRTGGRPRALLAQLGRLADYTARATFAKNYLEAGGIEAVPMEVTPDTAADAVRGAGTDVVVLCGSDTIYGERAAAAATALRSAGADLVLLAGRPGAREAEWTAAGIDRFIHAGDETLETLRHIARHLGVTE